MMGEKVDMGRRSFLIWAINGLGAIFAAILGIPSILYLLDPRHRTAEASFRPIEGIRLTSLREGEPVQGVIRAVRRDAWTLHPSDVIGRVWVVRTGPGPQEIKVFTTVCPHLGCSVNANNSADCAFRCPCHAAQYRIDGSVIDGPPPRPMDTLDWQLDPANPDLLRVQYQNFIQGIAEKIVKA